MLPYLQYSKVGPKLGPGFANVEITLGLHHITAWCLGTHDRIGATMVQGWARANFNKVGPLFSQHMAWAVYEKYIIATVEPAERWARIGPMIVWDIPGNLSVCE